MTEAPFTTTRLHRPVEAPFKGVCTAVAQATGTDPVLWRVLVVVLSVLGGGLGIALYLLGFVAIPAEGEDRSILERLFTGPDRHLERHQLLPVVILVIVSVLMLHSFGSAVALAVAVVLGYLWWRERPREERFRFYAPAAVPLDSTAVLPPPRKRRPRSPLTGLTISLAALTAGVLGLIGVGTSTSVPAEVVLASALGVVGLGLVIGSWWGRSTGLILLTVLLGLALAATVGARPALDHGVGDRTWVPTGSGSYHLGVGDATLDLRTLPLSEETTVNLDARVDVGHLLVLLPAGARVAVTSHATFGDLLIDGVDHNGHDVTGSSDLGPSGRPEVRLDLSVRTGQVEVRRA